MAGDSTSWQPLQIQPIGGINSEDNEAMIGDQECQSFTGFGSGTQNFLFDRQQASTRPGINSVTITGTVSGENLGWVAPVQTYTGNPANAFRTLDSQLIALGAGGVNLYTGFNGALSFAALTPPAGVSIAQVIAGPYNPLTIQAGLVNGVVLVGGLNMTLDGTGNYGIARWVPGASAYTQVGGVSPLFICGVLSRGFGAYDRVATNGQITVEWSVAGDETTWTGSTNGSGLAVLSDAADGITGLGVVNGVVVIARYTGFHFGTPTGQAFPAFSFKNYDGSTDIGCSWPGTFCVYNNICYFVGRDNVYTFDTINPPVPIGYKIRSLLLSSLLRAGNYNTTDIHYVGFVSNGQSAAGLLGNGVVYTNPARPRYHLVPIQGPINTPSTAYPHFSYDILTGVWSVHIYSTSWSFAFPLNVNATNYTSGVSAADNTGTQTIGFLQSTYVSSPTINFWDENQPCEVQAVLKTKTFRPGTFDRDYSLRRLMLSFRNQSSALNIGVAVKGTLGANLIVASAVYNPTLPGGSLGLWIRDWIDGLNQTYGQNINVNITTTAGTALMIDCITLELVESGGLRGY
jgi:hypothetical protein